MPCAGCPFGPNSVCMSPERRAKVTSAASSRLIQCHSHIGIDNIATHLLGGDWRLDAPVSIPCTGASVLVMP